MDPGVSSSRLEIRDGVKPIVELLLFLKIMEGERVMATVLVIVRLAVCDEAS